jgi:hypothetical protein
VQFEKLTSEEKQGLRELLSERLPLPPIHRLVNSIEKLMLDDWGRIWGVLSQRMPEGEVARITDYPYDFEGDLKTRVLKKIYRNSRGDLPTSQPEGAKRVLA